MTESEASGIVNDSNASAGRDVVLHTEELTKHFGGLTAVDAVNLDVRRNELRSVIGPNGAGKSTLFDLISGFKLPSAGQVTFLGEDVTDLPPHNRTQRGMARSFQVTDIFDSLTVRENVRVAAQATHDQRHNPIQRASSLDNVSDRTVGVLEEVQLSDLADLPARELAYGDQRKLELALALASDPELLLLDEPTAGVGPEESMELADLIASFTETRTVLLTEHDIDMIMNISDRIVVLHEGNVIAKGEPIEIANNEDVRQAYLGANND
jgi:branched-chain amino acid transport system ATP-binding protein